MLFSKKKNITKEQIQLITTVLTEKYVVTEKGLIKELIDNIIDCQVKIQDLEERVKQLEKQH